MRTETRGPHLFGLAKIDDADTLRQVLGGWWPGMDDVQPQRPLALVDRGGIGHVVDPGTDMNLLGQLAYPVHVVHAVTLPASAVKPASEARPYRR